MATYAAPQLPQAGVPAPAKRDADRRDPPRCRENQVIDGDEQLQRDDPEFGLLLSHELVLRGSDPPVGAAWYGTWAQETNHPLAPLPFHLLDIEREMPTGLPHYPGTLGASS